MISTTFGRAVVARHSGLAARTTTKVMKATPLAANTVLTFRTGPVSITHARAFSGSRAVFVATKKKTVATKKPAAKKVAAKKTTTRGKTAAAAKKTKAKKVTAAKKKAVPKKKKKVVAKKSVVAKRTQRKRGLTPIQKEARKTKAENAKRRARIAELKEASLIKEEPRLGTASTWLAYIATKSPQLRDTGMLQKDIFKALAESFKTTSETEIESLRATAKKNHEAAVATHEAWQKALSPTDISNANKARSSLKRLRQKTRSPIRDARIPKRPISGFLFFATQKMKTQEPGTKISENAKQAGIDWKAMSPTQKKVYEDMGAQDKKRYEQATKAAFGA